MKINKNNLLEKYNITFKTLNKYINKVGIKDYKKVSDEQFNNLMVLLEKNKKDKLLMQQFNANNINTTNLDDNTLPIEIKQIEFIPNKKSTGARLIIERQNYNELLALKDMYKKALDYALINNVNVYYVQVYNNLYLQVCKQIESKEKVISKLESQRDIQGNIFLDSKSLNDDYLNYLVDEYKNKEDE